jgi:hypothetical protein
MKRINCERCVSCRWGTLWPYARGLAKTFDRFAGEAYKLAEEVFRMAVDGAPLPLSTS